MTTVPAAFSGHSSFSGQVFAFLKNPFGELKKKILSNFEVIVFMVYFFGQKIVIEDWMCVFLVISATTLSGISSFSGHYSFSGHASELPKNPLNAMGAVFINMSISNF